MKISVVIPAHNEEQYLPHCLEKLIHQTRKADEIIVVDNNSTDKTAEIAKQYGATVITEKIKGISNARDAGFNAARGDIIVRCDADTIPILNWIEQIEKIMSDQSIDVITGSLSFLENPFLSRQLALVYIFLLYLFQGFHTINGFNMAIRKTMWEMVKHETGDDADGIQEDNDLAIIVAKHHGKIVYIDKLVMQASARRIMHNPKSFFFQYPRRYFFTIKRHWKDMHGYRFGKLLGM